MNREFVSYEIAVGVRELGFNEPCFTTYDLECKLRNPFDYAKSEYDLHLPYIEDTKGWIRNSDLTIENFNGPAHLYMQFVTAPTFSQAFRWFREKHDLHNGIYPYYDEYEFQIKDFRLPTNTPINGGLMNYEKAEQACVIKLIEIVKNK
jgi:hypothetical protein